MSEGLLAVIHPQTDMDIALLNLVQDALNRLPPQTAKVSHVWHSCPSWWTVQVQPACETAAEFDVSYDGCDLVSVNVGKTWIELFPIKTTADLDELKVGSRYTAIGMGSSLSGDALGIRPAGQTDKTHSMFVMSVQGGPSGGERYLSGHSNACLNDPFYASIVPSYPSGTTFFEYSNQIF